MRLVSSILLVVVASDLLALALLVIVRRIWSADKLREANDAAGFYSGAIGTLYAVMLAFTIAGVWGDFKEAQINAEQEANALVNMYHLAAALPTSLRDPIQDQCRTYAQVMIHNDWDAMARGDQDLKGQRLGAHMWRAVLPITPRTTGETVRYNQIVLALTQLMEHRRVRELESRTGLPPLFWGVLIVGGFITVGLTCLFSVSDRYLHGIKLVALTSLVSLTLMAVAEIDRPFQGDVHVPPDGFVLALRSFDVPPDDGSPGAP